MKEPATCRCGATRLLLPITISRSLSRNGGHYVCGRCKAKEAAAIRPQCRPGYWTAEKKAAHSKSVRSSDKYYASLPTRQLVNPMKGRKHTEETKRKMSIARTGKLGPLATAWKGGKQSLTKRVKKIIHTRYDWYKRVYQRDGFRCRQCGSGKKRIDAHHIDPVWKIIRRLIAGHTFTTEEEKLEWLVVQPELVDHELKNGITLCRSCHREAHKNWGSHECR